MSLNPDLTQAYSELDLTPGAGLDQIKCAYRRLAKASHPDLNPYANRDLISRLNQAYQVLRDHLASEGSSGLERAYVQAYERVRGQSASAEKPQNPVSLKEPPPAWRLLSLKRRERGLVYVVEVQGRPTCLSLPLRRERACPHCGGRGERRVWGSRVLCPSCRGKGRITKSVRVEVELPLAWRYGQSYRAPALDDGTGAAWLEIAPPSAGGGKG